MKSFTLITGHLCLTKEHLDNPEAQVVVESPLIGSCFSQFWFKSKKKKKNHIFKKSSTNLQDDLLPRRLQGVLQKRLQDIFKRSSRYLRHVLQKHLPDVFKTYHKVNCSCEDVFKASLRHVQNVSEAYCKDDYLQKDRYLHTSQKLMVSAYKMSKKDKSFSSFNFSLYYTI